MLPYTPVHPPNLARKGTSFGGYVEFDLSNTFNQAAILDGYYIPIDWCYTGIFDDPQINDIRYNFLPPATSITLTLDIRIDGDHTIYEDCAEVLVYARKIEPPIDSPTGPKTMLADNDYVAAAWYWGDNVEFQNVIQPPRRRDYYNPRGQVLTITGPSSYWGVLVRPGTISLPPGLHPPLIIRAQADLGISTYPDGGNIRINQPYCVPPFIPCGSNYPGSYLFQGAAVDPRPRQQNAAALRQFESRFIRMFSADSLHTFEAQIWGGPWKIGAVAGVTDAADPPSITLAIEDQSHTPAIEADSGAFLSPTVVSVSGPAVRGTVDFVAHPVVKITGEEIASTDVAAGIYLEGAI